jgi:hypothetical protein
MGDTSSDAYVVLHRFASNRWSVLVRTDESGVIVDVREEVGPAQTVDEALHLVASLLEEWSDCFPASFTAWPTTSLWATER